MFDWIGGKLNDALGTTTTLRASDPTLLSAANWMGLRDVFGFEPPRAHGHTVIEAIAAMERGEAKVFVGLGGNFAVAAPAPDGRAAPAPDDTALAVPFANPYSFTTRASDYCMCRRRVRYKQHACLFTLRPRFLLGRTGRHGVFCL